MTNHHKLGSKANSKKDLTSINIKKAPEVKLNDLLKKSKANPAVVPKEATQDSPKDPNENIYLDKNLKIVERFSKEDADILEKLKAHKFEDNSMFDLKLKAEEAAKDSEITELISYPLIKKRLTYNLPHQQEGALKILRDLDGRALLADEVGLGKTITAGMVLKECIVRGFVKRALILTPPSLVTQWKEELTTKFDLDFKTIEKESEWENTELAIASIDKVKNFDINTETFKHSKAHEIYWDIIVIDEAHKLKDKKTYRWKFVDRLQKKRLLLLTATPFQNDLIELYNLLSLLRRGHLGTLREFREKFLVNGNERQPLNPRELKRKLGEVMIRRRRDETKGVNYMKRIPNIHSVELTKDERWAYDNVVNLLLSHYYDYKGNAINTVLAIHSILPKITSSSHSSIEFLENLMANPKYSKDTQDLAKGIAQDFKNLKVDTKLAGLIKIIDEILSKDKKDKILIYTKHPATLKYISETLRKKSIKVVEFQGGLNPIEKTKRIKEFADKMQIMISTDAGAEGLNFQFCSNIINYDLPWNPMAVEQRIGRLDRIGQKKDIKVYNLATKNTMEEQIVDLIINKMCCIGLIMGELPIILFNMGLDSSGTSGSSKFEEKLMHAFLDSKNNLTRFATEIDKVGYEINQGIKEYEKTKKYTTELLD
jgi:SNF2 family DNA or RNA helicase